MSLIIALMEQDFQERKDLLDLFMVQPKKPWILPRTVVF
jgi:hypothetical protein